MECNGGRDTVYQSGEPDGVEEEGWAFDSNEGELDDVDADHDEGKPNELYQDVKRYEERDDGVEVMLQGNSEQFG